MLSFAWAICAPAFGDRPVTLGDRPAASDNDQVEAFELDELPEPPPWIASLLQRAEVTFSAGHRRARTRPNPGLRGGRLRIAAETEFKMGYRYRSSTRWYIRRDQDDQEKSKRVLVIRVRMPTPKLDTSHHIWFRHRPDDDGFWENQLVLHELDHVLISSDPSLQSLYRTKVKKLKVIEYDMDLDEKASGEKATEELVKRIVDEKMQAAFQDVSDLASIRYVELDQVTRHGQRPLPTRYRESNWFSESVRPKTEEMAEDE